MRAHDPRMGSPTEFLRTLHARYAALRDGRPADYIPELAKADSDAFGIASASIGGQVDCAGDCDLPFTLQSISKPFMYGLALERLGRDAVRCKVGVEPTGEAFNSIVELEEDVHLPYNPMINSGAIAITAMLHEAEPVAATPHVMAMFDAFFGRPARVDEAVVQSELATGHRNRAIAHLLRHFGVIGEDIEAVLQLYSRQCSLTVTTRELSLMAATLANGGRHPVTGQQAVPQRFVPDILSLMFTCGMYDSAGEWAYSVGLPGKSGVSGGIIAVVPGRMGLAVFSPPLDRSGHSVRGLHVMRELSVGWGLGLFGRSDDPAADAAQDGARRSVSAG
jgi:glutaminase